MRGITMITAKEIIEIQSPDLQFQDGPLDVQVKRVLPPEEATEESLVFVSKPEQLQAALSAQAPIIIAHNSLNLPQQTSRALFTTSSIQRAMADVLPLFDLKKTRFTTGIHSSAVVHSTAHIGQNVSIGAQATIGENVVIGDHTTIGANCTLEHSTRVGANTLIHPRVFIGARTIIGSNCEIHPHTTIGADGFSFTTLADGTHKKIPQLGRVEIGDDVEIGASCTIDRAALTATKIGSGSKMDNLCHIAHNVSIGKNCLMAAGFKIAGSSHVGDNCVFAGDVSVADHVKICDQVMIAGRGVVTNDITSPGKYGGYPLETLQSSLKTIQNKTHLTQMRKDLSKVLKHLGLKE